MPFESDARRPDEPIDGRLDCPGCVRSFRTASSLARHLRWNPSHGDLLAVDEAGPSRPLYDNDWIRFPDRVERALVVPRSTERIDVTVRNDDGVVEISGDYATTVALPDHLDTASDTLAWSLESGVLRLAFSADDRPA